MSARPWVGLGLGVAAGMAVWWLWPRDVATREPVPSAVAAPVLRWQPGMRYAYRFAFIQDSSTVVPGLQVAPPVPAHVDVEGELHVRAYGEQQGMQRLGLRFVSLRRHVLEVMGANTLVDEAPLLAHEAVVHVDHHGLATALSFAPQQAEMSRRLMQLVWSEIQVRTADTTPWEVMETTQHGDVMSRYTVSRGAGGTDVLDRVRHRYARLNVTPQAHAVEQEVLATARVVLAAQGHPVSLDAQEQLRVRGDAPVPLLESQSATSLRLLRVDAFPAEEARSVLEGATQTRGPMDVADTGEGRRNALLLRAAGLTGPRLLLDLRMHATMDRLPDHNRWLWRATGLLQLEPALCAQLVTLFQDKTLGHETRALILDLLVGAGHAAAQDAMREILQTPAAKKSRHASLLYQRMSLVKEPTPETMRFLEDNYRRTRGTPHNPTMYSLGSGVGHRYRAGDRAGALAAVRPLVEDLGAATQPQHQVWLLESLGNAGLPEHTGLVAQYTRAEDAQVRHAAATALRKMPGGPARAALLGLLSDPSVDVQQRALLSLDVRTLSDEEMLRVLDLVRNRAVDEQNYQSLVTMLQPALGSRDAVVDIYRAILEQTLQDPTVKSRIRNLLGV